MDGDFTLGPHVESIAARTHAEAERIARSLVGRSWPGGHHDRSERGAIDWVRRWTPRSVPLELVACSCAHGRCVVCN
jgi:hypothetical protein